MRGSLKWWQAIFPDPDSQCCLGPDEIDSPQKGIGADQTSQQGLSISAKSVRIRMISLRSAIIEFADLVIGFQDIRRFQVNGMAGSRFIVNKSLDLPLMGT